MNNRGNAIRQINEFINSETEKVMFIKGTHQYAKHSLVLDIVNRNQNLNTGLFRINVLGNVATFLDQAGYEVSLVRKFSSGKPYRLKNNILYFDSLLNKPTWRRSPSEFDFALVYPMDSFCESNEQTKREFLEDILERKTIKKVFIVTWTDTRHEYEWLTPIIDRSIVFDVEEEDPEYHKRVLS